MHRLVVVLMLVAVSADAEPHRRGAIVGLRVTDMTGQVDSEPYPGFALAGDLELLHGERFSTSIEPGIRWSGTSTYRMIYLGLPVVATLRQPVGDDWRLRASIGLLPSLLATGTFVHNSGYGELRTSITEHLRRWDLEVLAGIGLERRCYFAELRIARGLFTVHDDVPTLFAFHQELGLWVGVMR